MESFDIIIIGAGIAGASAAFEMSKRADVIVLEMEEQAGTHATGRSAAFFTETYGNATIRALATGSKKFLTEPPHEFTSQPVLKQLGALYIGRQDQIAKLEQRYASVHALVPNVESHGPQFALERVPILRPEYVAGCVWEPDCKSIDVHELLTSYLRGAKSRGAAVRTDAAVTSLRRQQGVWVAETPEGDFCAPLVVNAAGAWADQVAKMAGLAPLGLTPMRRTVSVIDPPDHIDPRNWPLVHDIDEQFYFKPDNRQLWLTPEDETPMPPCDIYPEDMDVAIAVDRFEKATSMQVRRVEHTWAGLRTFAPDRTPVVGFDPEAEGFFWLAGQGGYGILTSPAMSRLSASLIEGNPMPEDLAELGVTAATLTPKRFRA